MNNTVSKLVCATCPCLMVLMCYLIPHDIFKVIYNYSNKSPTRCNNCPVYFLTFIYSSTCFGRCPARHQELNDCCGSLWFSLRIVVTVVLCLWSGRPVWPRTQHDCHHDTKVKPEAATAVIELLMMGGKTLETCWAVNKSQVNKLKNCCIRVVIYLN